MTRNIHGIEVFGIEVDPETRCRHWNSDTDIIALRFKCCGRWYPCFDCHKELADHEPTIWSLGERNQIVVLCGACGRQLSIQEYLDCNSTCPNCSSAFNPGCAKHYGLYFE